MVHEKTDRTQYPILRPQFQPTPEPDPIYQGTRAVTCKHRLVHEFFAKYMLQIGYLTYCTTVSKCYLHLFCLFFCFIGPILWGHSGPLCHALSLSSSSWTSMRGRRATVATSGEWQCKTGSVRWLAVANGPNIFQMLLVSIN